MRFELQFSRLPGKGGSTRPQGTTSSLIIWLRFMLHPSHREGSTARKGAGKVVYSLYIPVVYRLLPPVSIVTQSHHIQSSISCLPLVVTQSNQSCHIYILSSLASRFQSASPVIYSLPVLLHNGEFCNGSITKRIFILQAFHANIKKRSEVGTNINSTTAKQQGLLYLFLFSRFQSIFGRVFC